MNRSMRRSRESGWIVANRVQQQEETILQDKTMINITTRQRQHFQYPSAETLRIGLVAPIELLEQGLERDIAGVELSVLRQAESLGRSMFRHGDLPAEGGEVSWPQSDVVWRVNVSDGVRGAHQKQPHLIRVGPPCEARVHCPSAD